MQRSVGTDVSCSARSEAANLLKDLQRCERLPLPRPAREGEVFAYKRPRCKELLQQGPCILFCADDQLAVLLVADERLAGEHVAAQDALRQQRLDRVL